MIFCFKTTRTIVFFGIMLFCFAIYVEFVDSFCRLLVVVFYCEARKGTYLIVINRRSTYFVICVGYRKLEKTAIAEGTQKLEGGILGC